METVKIESIHDEITVRAHPDGDIEVWQGPHEMTVESADLPALIAALQAALPDGGWLPIEIAPKDGTPIWVDGGVAYWGPSMGSGWGWISLAAKRLIEWEVTHWQPLPLPPPSSQGEGR